MKRIVVITHRYHYHITRVAIKLILKKFNPDEIAILFDDVVGTQRGWGDLGRKLLDDVRKDNNYSTSIFALPFSSLPNVHLEQRGWIRQQYVKLNLHKILKGDEWVVIDGDTLVTVDIDPWKYWYLNLEHNTVPHHDLFIRYVLNLENQQPMFENKPVDFSAFPIRLLTRKTLENLESYIFDLHGTNVQGIRNSFTLKKNKEFYFELSEYGLISNYQHFISKDLLPIKKIEMYVVPNDRLMNEWNVLKNYLAVLHGNDNLSVEWYKMFEIEINREIWNLLYVNQN
jgi:hypothetical protein